MWMTGIRPTQWETGSWADLAGLVGGPLLRLALVLGGMMSAFGMFNSLVMSYSRLPLAMAQDGMLPKVFGKVHPKTRVPWVSILVLATGWALCLGLGFERLVTIDVLIYGCSLLLEFLALIFLRIREPNLPRAFRVPGGMVGAVMVGIVPMALLGYSIYSGDHEQILGMSAFTFGLIVISGGFIFYGIDALVRRDQRSHADRAVAEPEPLS
jgi:amino acid transporter